MSLRRFSPRRSIARAPGLGWVLPALALAIGALTWRHFASPPPLPRLPVRRIPPRPSRAERASVARSRAPAPQVVVPHAFWDVDELDEEQDDPAEIPYRGLPLVSEASQSTALLDPADREASSVVLHW